MWMKAELTECPHSSPAGLTAPLAGSAQLSAQRQGKYYPSLQRPGPHKGSSGDPSPTPSPVPRAWGLADPGWMLVRWALPQEEVRMPVPVHRLHLSTYQEAPQSRSSWVLKGVTSVKQPRFLQPLPSPTTAATSTPKAKGIHRRRKMALPWTHPAPNCPK